MNMSIINKISNIVSYIFNNVFAFSMLFMFLIIISLLIFNINRNNNIIKISVGILIGSIIVFTYIKFYGYASSIFLRKY